MWPNGNQIYEFSRIHTHSSDSVRIRKHSVQKKRQFKDRLPKDLRLIEKCSAVKNCECVYLFWGKCCFTADRVGIENDFSTVSRYIASCSSNVPDVVAYASDMGLCPGATDFLTGWM